MERLIHHYLSLTSFISIHTSNYLHTSAPSLSDLSNFSTPFLTLYISPYFLHLSVLFISLSLSLSLSVYLSLPTLCSLPFSTASYPMSFRASLMTWKTEKKGKNCVCVMWEESECVWCAGKSVCVMWEESECVWCASKSVCLCVRDKVAQHSIACLGKNAACIFKQSEQSPRRQSKVR